MAAPPGEHGRAGAGCGRLLGARAGAVDADGRLGGVRRGRAADGGDVVEQRAVGVVADGGDHRHAEQRDGATQRLVAEAQQVGERAAAARDDRHLDAADRHELAERAHDRGRRVAVLHGREGPHQTSRPAAARERREHVVARLAALAGDDADRARQHRRRQALLGLEQPLAVELLAQALDPREQVAVAGEAQVEHGEGEAGRGRGAAGVVVAAAGDDHLHALRRRAGTGDHRLPVRAPGRARDRAAGVAQLEVHARAGGAQVDELAHQLHARERAQLASAARRRTRRPDTDPAARCPGCPPRAAGPGRRRRTRNAA